MKMRRRRRGFDEERKRELRQDLRNYFINSKNLNYSNNNGFSRATSGNSFGGDEFSEAAFSSADYQLDPQSQLERAKQSNYNFGKIGISSPSTTQEEDKATTQEDKTTTEKQEEETTSKEKEKKSADKEKEESIKEEDTSAYSRYQLEQLEKQRQNKYQDDPEKIQTLVDLPAALESDNRELGHSVKAFADPYLILKELLWMAGRQNPELDVIQRLWLVWTRWYGYYSAWFSINRDEDRFLPGRNSSLPQKDRQKQNYQSRGIHQLETASLEGSMLQIMRWEFARKVEMERQFNPIPTVSQLHGYFVGLRRRKWDSTSWQYRVYLGSQLITEDEDDKQLQSTSEPEE